MNIADRMIEHVTKGATATAGLGQGHLPSADAAASTADRVAAYVSGSWKTVSVAVADVPASRGIEDAIASMLMAARATPR